MRQCAIYLVKTYLLCLIEYNRWRSQNVGSIALNVFFLAHRGSPMRLRLCVTSFVLAETRQVSFKRFPSLTLCLLCSNRKSERCARAHARTHAHTYTHMRAFTVSEPDAEVIVVSIVLLQAGVCGAVVAEYVLG